MTGHRPFSALVAKTEKRTYEVGKTAWFFAPRHTGEKTEGLIVHTFEDVGVTQYVLRRDIPEGYLYYVRDADTLAPTADARIGLWEQAARRARSTK